MTFPKGVADNPDALQYDLPEGVFDPEMFEDMRSFLGDAEIRLSLMDLSAGLQRGLLDITSQNPDRNDIFQTAHTLGGRAGMMGFVALRDACWKLQHAVSTGANIGPACVMAEQAAMATQLAIAVLHQKLL
ncbi:MAG: Hpt domain-containing protein [Candidatus Saccharibacteria bacterium]|nr:Hpt domain-containing protein [Pseudorhodobacter sp.]